jgi:hypothetical protein
MGLPNIIQEGNSSSLMNSSSGGLCITPIGCSCLINGTMSLCHPQCLSHCESEEVLAE